MAQGGEVVVAGCGGEAEAEGTVVAGEGEEGGGADHLGVEGDDGEHGQRRVGSQAVVTGVVRRLAVLRLERHLCAGGGQPPRHERAPSPGVEHHIGGEGRPVLEPHPRHDRRTAAVTDDEAGRLRGAHEGDPFVGFRGSTQRELERGASRVEPVVGVVLGGPELLGRELLEEVRDADPVRFEPVEDLGRVFEQQRAGASREAVGLAELRDVAAIPRVERLVTVVGVEPADRARRR